jgi:hypothetical protein
MIFKTLLQTASIIPLLWSSTAAQTTQACNNSPALCSRPYNNITHLGAHNSPFVRDSSTSFSTAGNHYFNSTVQLSAGVRLLTAQVHRDNSTDGTTEWKLCHSFCNLLDAGTLTNWLVTIKAWMDANPNEVVTLLLVNADGASADDLGTSFTSSGITQYAYAPPTAGVAPTEWPTLQSMIANSTRLVTFVASLPASSPSHPYLLDEFTYIYENPFETTTATNYSCVPDRPSTLRNDPETASASGRMFLMNHFLYEQQLFGIETPNVTYIQTTNGALGIGSLGEQLGACGRVYGEAPTFVLVDFFNVGPVPAIASIDRVNGVAGPVGRSVVTDAVMEGQTTSAAVGRRKGSWVAVVLAFGVVVGLGI